MGIAAYIKVIGRGKDGARPLSREQAHELLSQVLDCPPAELEVGMPVEVGFRPVTSEVTLPMFRRSAA